MLQITFDLCLQLCQLTASTNDSFTCRFTHNYLCKVANLTFLPVYVLHYVSFQSTRNNSVMTITLLCFTSVLCQSIRNNIVVTIMFYICVLPKYQEQ